MLNPFYYENRVEPYLSFPGNGCALYIRYKDKTSGYGRINIKGTVYYTHRIAWEYFNEKRIPKEKEIHHKCGIRHCCEAQHLQLVTPQENMRFAVGHTLIDGKWFCKRKHELNPSSYFIQGGHIRCVSCNREEGLKRFYEIKHIKAILNKRVQ